MTCFAALLVLFGSFAPITAPAQEPTAKANAGTIDEDHDGLPGATSRNPTRKDIEDLIRALGRDPVTPELVDRIDAMFRPRWPRFGGFAGAKQAATDPAFVAKIDEAARDLTGKPADTRSLIASTRLVFNSLDKAGVCATYRAELERERGPRLTIQGGVADEEEGNPLAGVVVATEGVLTRTDAKGEYTLKVPRPKAGSHICLSFEKPGRALGRSYLTWAGAVPEAEVRDCRMPKSVPFAGRVIDPSGKPLAGVELELWLAGEATCRDDSDEPAGMRGYGVILGAVTDARGLYAFRNVPPDLPDGRQAVERLKVMHPRHVAREKVYAEDEMLGPGWEITLEPGCVVSGLVADSRGEPIAGARVAAHPEAEASDVPTGETDKDGKFRFEDLPESFIRFVVRPPAHAIAIVSAEAKKDAPAELKITVEPGVYLAGKVIAKGGEPVRGSRIHWWVEPIDERGRSVEPSSFWLVRTTSTEGDGTLRVGPVAKGRRYRITASLGSTRAVTEVEAQHDGQPLVLELQLEEQRGQ